MSRVGLEQKPKQYIDLGAFGLIEVETVPARTRKITREFKLEDTQIQGDHQCLASDLSSLTSLQFEVGPEYPS